MKQQENWDRDDWLDFLDGWHEECGDGFKSTRSRARVVSYTVEPEKSPGDMFSVFGADMFGADPQPEPETINHPSSHLFDLGRDHRIAHRKATGL